jgi:hypothetical protein
LSDIWRLKVSFSLFGGNNRNLTGSWTQLSLIDDKLTAF